MCKKIHRGGNAEQYNADKKYKEAVAVAVKKCADDVKGQTCYICKDVIDEAYDNCQSASSPKARMTR